MGLVDSKPVDRWSYAVPNSAKAGKCSATIRSIESAHRLLHPADSGSPQTLYELFQSGLASQPNGNCVGWRVNNADGTSRYAWFTYKQAQVRITNIASGLRHLGLVAVDMVALYSINRLEWVLAEHACNSMSMITVPLYDTLGADAGSYIMKETELTLCFTSAACFPRCLEMAATGTALKIIIIFEGKSVEDVEKAKKAGITLYSLRELESLGASNPAAPTPPKPDDVATICYTSGTTGNPKGAMVTHLNFAAAVNGTNEHMDLKFDSRDTHCSYLPLAHIFERIIQAGCWRGGSAVGFFAGDVAKLLDDLQVLKPTIFPSVPRLYNRIYDKLMQGINASSGAKKLVLDAALQSKGYYLTSQGYRTHEFWDQLLFAKMRLVMGGRLRLMVTGAAPISNQVKAFIQIVFCCPCLEGYGLTETSGTSVLCNSRMISVGNVGVPNQCAEIRLTDVPDMNYSATDLPCPRGEVCHRGYNVFKGYYKQPKITAESFDDEGWFHSGDIGRINVDGTISIIDRKKNIFKLQQGEYVAPEKIENVYQRSKWIAQCFVTGDSLKTKLVAVVVPDPDVVEEWRKKTGRTGDLASLCKAKELVSIIHASMEEVATLAKLAKFEMVAAFTIDHEPFSVTNDLLTPTFKLKRTQTQKKYQRDVERMYRELGE